MRSLQEIVEANTEAAQRELENAPTDAAGMDIAKASITWALRDHAKPALWGEVAPAATATPVPAIASELIRLLAKAAVVKVEYDDLRTGAPMVELSLRIPQGVCAALLRYA